MRVLALTFGDSAQASSCYRVYQYIEPLRRFGITLETRLAKGFNDWRSLADYDLALVQKRLYSSGKVRAIRRQASKLVYDVDDAIWHPHGKAHAWVTRVRTAWRLRAIASRADMCIAANTVLARHLRQWSTRVTVLPMSLNERVWTPKPVEVHGGPVRVGWAGHPVNFPYLQAIQPALLDVQRACPQVQFVMYSGKKPALPGLAYEYLPFRADTEPEAMRSFDIGLLPLPADDAFAGGKSPIKGLQYMACGLPTVVTPLGATEAMFEEGTTAVFARTITEWTQQIRELSQRPDRRKLLGRNARKAFEDTYALGLNVARYADLLREAGQGAG